MAQEPLRVEPRKVRLRDLTPLAKEKNARYMTGAQFKQLVANLEVDGALTSTPTVHKGVILSGNHRVEAAIKAGIEEAWVLEILNEELPEGRKVGVQLSHNAITGQDDPNLLADQYKALDFEWAQYSGLTDDVLKSVSKLESVSLSVGPPQYTEMLLAFLPEEHEAFLDDIEKVTKHAGKRPAFVARYADFDGLFDAVVRTKKLKNVQNIAVTMAAIVELALERIAELEAEREVTGGAKDE